MTWYPSVPFPAENLGTCRGCGSTIGWVRRADNDKPHPVDPKGYAGLEVFMQEPDAKAGYTREGDRVRVVEPGPDVPASQVTVCFESHFATCPKAHRFRRAARHSKGA